MRLYKGLLVLCMANTSRMILNALSIRQETCSNKFSISVLNISFEGEGIYVGGGKR